MGRNDVVVPADTVDSMISKLEEALAGLEGAFAGMWSYLTTRCQNLYGRIGTQPRGNWSAAATSHRRAAGVLKSSPRWLNRIATA